MQVHIHIPTLYMPTTWSSRWQVCLSPKPSCPGRGIRMSAFCSCPLSQIGWCEVSPTAPKWYLPPGGEDTTRFLLPVTGDSASQPSHWGDRLCAWKEVRLRDHGTIRVWFWPGKQSLGPSPPCLFMYATADLLSHIIRRCLPWSMSLKTIQRLAW